MSTAEAPTRVLLVDDDAPFRNLMAAELRRRGFRVDNAADARSAFNRVSEMEPDVILLDLRLPDMDGIEALERLRERDLAEAVVILTGHGTIDTAIQAVRLGAADYLEKPCPMDKVEMTIERIRRHRATTRRQRVLEDGYSLRELDGEMVGVSLAYGKLRRDVSRVAKASSTVLILGETGVGKEMVAKLLHAESPRSSGPFVVVDCAGLREELLESELFGHEKGAFTGASQRKHGLFEVATGGSIFLDEIGEASPDIQAKLLRVLETGRFRRLGGTAEIGVDVRVISATNRDLPQAVERGIFRKDLYFRLSTLTLRVPPLRERPEDIPPLLSHFTRRLNHRLGREKRIGDDAMAVLRAHDWPGNVRELIHVLEQAIVLADGDVVMPEDLPAGIRPARPIEPRSPEDTPLPLCEMERRHVLSVLERVGGNRGKAARLLHVSERNLYRLLRRYEARREGACAPPRPAGERQRLS